MAKPILGWDGGGAGAKNSLTEPARMGVPFERISVKDPRPLRMRRLESFEVKATALIARRSRSIGADPLIASG